MGDKIILNDIIQKMNNAFPENNLTELEKARYLYIELGKLFRFDLDYISMSDYKTEDAYWKSVDFDNIEINSFTCRQISAIYAETLKRAGINAVSINKPKSDEQLMYDPEPNYHRYTVISLSDGREFIADLVDDLAYIQQGMETIHFGNDLEEKLPKVVTLGRDEILAIDTKIGYSYPKDIERTSFVYVDDFIQMIKEDMQNEDHLRDYISINFSEEEANNYKSNMMIKYKFDVIGRFFNTKKMGAREGKIFLDKMFSEFFTEEERKEIKAYTLITEHEDGRHLGKTDLIKCYAWKKSEEEYEYFLYEEGKDLRNISKEELEGFLKREQYVNKWDRYKIPGLNLGLEEDER